MTQSPTSTLHLQRPVGRLAYDVAGSGPLVVAVPGMGDLRAVWRDLVPALVDAGFRVATFDLRDHGDSDITGTAWGDREVADDLLALVDALGGPAIVIGNSLAGSAAVIASALAPEKVAATVLVSPFLREGGPTGAARGALNLLYRVLFARPWGAAAWAGYYAGTLNRGGRAPWLDEHVAAIRSALSRPGRLAAFRRLALTLHHRDVEQYVDAAAAVPSLAIVGASDPDFRDAAAELAWIGEHLHGETLLVPDAAHYAHAQQAATVLPRIVAFAVAQRDHAEAAGGAGA